MNLKRFLITSCLQYSCTVVSKEVAFTRRTLVLSVRQEVSAMEVSPECCKSFMLRSRFSQSPQKWSQDSLAGLISISLCQIPSVTCMAPAALLVFGWQCKDTIIVNKTSRTKFFELVTSIYYGSVEGKSFTGGLLYLERGFFFKG